MEYKKPFVYIDTNFSPADGIFLKMALNSFAFELVGISANRSYMSSKQACDNILGLVVKEGLYISVAANKDDKASAYDKKIYQTKRDYPEDVDAYENLYDIASDCGRLDIIATGDLSNIAKALREYDDMIDFIDHIFLYLPDPKKLDANDLEDLDYILTSGIELFMIDDKFIDGFTLRDNDMVEIFKKNQDLGDIFDYYKNSKNQRLISPMLLYLLERPEAFIFEEVSLRVDFEEKSLEKTKGKNLSYLVNRVNEDSFYDYLEGKLC